MGKEEGSELGKWERYVRVVEVARWKRWEDSVVTR